MIPTAVIKTKDRDTNSLTKMNQCDKFYYVRTFNIVSLIVIANAVRKIKVYYIHIVNTCFI